MGFSTHKHVNKMETIVRFLTSFVFYKDTRLMIDDSASVSRMSGADAGRDSRACLARPILRRDRGQGKKYSPCSANHE